VSKKHKRTKRFPFKKFFKLSTIYFILFMALFGMIDYYAMMQFNALWFLATSVVISMLFSFYHIKLKKHDHIDDVANEIL
jgi:hypothetical protein